MPFYDATIARSAKDFFDAISIGVAGGYRRNKDFAEKDFYSQLVTSGFKWIKSPGDGNDQNRAGRIAEQFGKSEFLKISFDVDEITQRKEAEVGADIAFIVNVTANDEKLPQRGFLAQLKSGKVDDGLGKFNIRYVSKKNWVEQAQLMLNATQHSVFFVSIPFDQDSERVIRENFVDGIGSHAPSRYSVMAANQILDTSPFDFHHSPLLYGANTEEFLYALCNFYGVVSPHKLRSMFERNMQVRASSAASTIYEKFKSNCLFLSERVYGSRAQNAIRVLHADSVFRLDKGRQTLEDIMNVSTPFSSFFLRDVFAYEFGDTDSVFIKNSIASKKENGELGAIVNINVSIRTQSELRDD